MKSVSSRHRFLAVSMILAIALSVFTLPIQSANGMAPEHPQTQTNPLEDPDILGQRIAFSELANTSYDALLAYWGGEPPFLGGAYIDGDKLHIQVTVPVIEVIDEVQMFVAEEILVLEQVAYSLEELKNVQEFITEALLTESSQIVGVGVDEAENIVFVEMSEEMNGNGIPIADIIHTVQDDLQAKMRAGRNDNQLNQYDLESMIQFRYRDEVYRPKDAVQAGVNSYTTNGRTGRSSTISFNAKRVNSKGVVENGFVVAGHTAALSDQMKIGSTVVGGTAWRVYGGKVDAAFVNMNNYPNSGYEQSNILSKDYTILGFASVGLVGTVYTMHGMRSGIIAGSVDNRSFNFIMNGISFTDHVRMRMKIAQGDSGGPLVHSTGGYNRWVVGIASGGDNTYSNFSKTLNILSLMNGDIY